MENKHRCLFISDFNIDNLAAYLNNDQSFPEVSASVAPFGNVTHILMHENQRCWKQKTDLVVIWTLPERTIKSFDKVLNYEKVPLGRIYKEVDEFASLLSNVKGRAGNILVVSWVIPSYHRGWGILDMKEGTGVKNILMRMNLRLSEVLEKVPGTYLLDAQKWISIGGRNAFNPKLWYMGKIPFENELFKEAAKDIKSALLSLTGNTKKLIILDLDDTLWGGIVGDVGIGHLNLGGHDHIGEAYADFQRALKSLINRGILLGLVSKNEEPVALEAIKKHPEMILKLDDFAGWRINWGDKAQNIADLVSELNLGLDSVVFIDDSPLERARVREALPEVYVPEWPVDKMLYRSTLLSLPCFDTVSITKEDLERSKSYAAERMRKNERLSIPSSEDWLKALKIKVVCEELNENNIQRTAQLLNKTNQMNLSTRRMREAEFKQWAAYSLHKVMVFRVSDKFGHLGLTGIISAQIKDKEAKVIDFILSCRAFGRKIEETMLYVLCRYAKKNKLKRVYMEYIPTKKNKPCLEFLENSCFSNKAENVFVWDLKKEYKPVPFVKLIAIAVKS